MELNLLKFVSPVILLLFTAIYAFVLVAGVSIFYHIRWFGLKRDAIYRRIEWLFITTNLVIFLINVVLLGLLYIQ